MPRIANTPRQPNRSPITPAIEAPSTLAVSAMPSSRAIATWRWLHRHEIAEQRHRHREHAARHEPGHDPHGDQQREAGRNRADERGDRHHQHAGVHQPGLAEEIAGDAQHRLDQRVGKGEGGRQQRRGLHVDGEIGSDHRNDRIDRAGENRLGEDDEGNDFENRRDGAPRYLELLRRADRIPSAAAASLPSP